MTLFFFFLHTLIYIRFKPYIQGLTLIEAVQHTHLSTSILRGTSV